MTKHLTLLLLIGLAWGQSFKKSNKDKTNIPLNNPCEDKRFLKIKNKSLDDMSEREYQYFLKIDEECNEYQGNSKNNKRFMDSDLCKKAVELGKNDKQKKWFWLGMLYGAGVPISYFSNPTPSEPSVLYNLSFEDRNTFLECYRIEARKHSIKNAWKGCGTLLLIVAIANGSSNENTTIGRTF